VLFRVNEAARRLEAVKIESELGSCTPGQPQWDLARKLALCAATTVITFGVLAFSTTPVLRAIGVTVALGAVLSLVLAIAALGTPRASGTRTIAS